MNTKNMSETLILTEGLSGVASMIFVGMPVAATHEQAYRESGVHCGLRCDVASMDQGDESVRSLGPCLRFEEAITPEEIGAPHLSRARFDGASYGAQDQGIEPCTGGVHWISLVEPKS